MNRESLVYYSNWLQEYFVDKGMNLDLAVLLNTIINAILVSVLVILLDILVRKFIVEAFKAFSNKTRTTYDDFLIKSNFPRFVAHFAPLLAIWYLTPIIFSEFPLISTILLGGIDIYLIVLGILVFRSVLRTTKNYLQQKERYQDKPLESYVQVLMIFAWGIGIFAVIYLLTGDSIKILTTFGAASAIILLIFKDTILGFVASMQISINDIVRIGDWITVSKYGADGNVTEINLATVRVQNFDNTYTTIPTYSLISDSFQNWRGMQEAGGRRIKRSVFIKQNSVKFISSEEIEALKKIALVKPYIEHRQKDIDSFNKKLDPSSLDLQINGKNQTNLGVFRKYIDAFLHENPAINKDMFLMIRHLAPTNMGIPLEIYCFSYDKRWENYEYIQADIFDHILAAVPYFGLEIFELPSGVDFNMDVPKG